MIYEKNTNKEMTGRNANEKEADVKLLGFHKRCLDRFGPNWNQHSLVTIERQIHR